MSRAYKTITPHPVHVPSYIQSLGFKSKLPLDFEWEGLVELYATYPVGVGGRRRPMGKFYCKTIRADRQGVPRNFVRNAGRWVPMGRTAQAKDHSEDYNNFDDFVGDAYTVDSDSPQGMGWVDSSGRP